MPVSRIALPLLALAYPLLVYFGLTVLEPRWLGLALLALLLLRHWRDGVRLLRGLAFAEGFLLLAMVAFSITIVAANSELLLRLYPAGVSLGLLALFAHSLVRPPSMVERFARLAEPDLPPEGVRYTRRVTQVWCVFMAFNGTIAFLTAFASRETWVLWNGLISYLLMGGLFAGEWLIRRRVRASGTVV